MAIGATTGVGIDIEVEAEGDEADAEAASFCFANSFFLARSAAILSGSIWVLGLADGVEPPSGAT